MKQVLLITGGGRGIGAATARLAAEKGYAVCVNYLSNAAAADRVVKEIEAKGGEAITVAADVSREEDVMRLFDTVDRELGLLTALVNCTGILEPQMRLEDMELRRLQRMFATNITGSFLCAREAVRRMSRKHGGHGGGIVNISSTAARVGAPGEYVDYAASKAAIEALTLGLSKEVAGEGIRVNTVRPGFIDTTIHADGGEPGRVERMKELIPLGRGGEPEEVARAIVWLLSEDASYTTGATLDVTGGR